MKIIDYVRSSISRKLFLGFFCVSFVPLLIMAIVSYYTYIGIIEKKTVNYNHELLKTMAEKLENYINRIDQLASTVYQENIQYILNQKDKSDIIKNIKDMMEIDLTFQRQLNFFNFHDEINGVYILNNDGSVYYSSKGAFGDKYDFSKEEWFNNIVFGIQDKVLIGPYYKNKIDTSMEKTERISINLNELSISYVKRIGSIGPTGKGLGIILINFSMTEIDHVLIPLRAGKESEVLLLNEQGQTVLSNNASTMLKRNDVSTLKEDMHTFTGYFVKKIENQKVLITYYRSKLTGWDIIGVNKVSDLIVEARNIRIFTALLLASSFLVAIIISIVLSMSLVNPIKRLRNKMVKVKNGDLNVFMTVHTKDEIGDLSTGFNEMIAKIRYLIEEVYQTQLHEKEAHLDALQAQINPHFLYNTFETISSIAMVEEVEKISDITKAMSAMFRYSTRLGRELVPISEEINHINNYLSILAIRYENRFEISMDIPEEALAYKIIKLVLQPIVENAIYHGIELKPGKGKISITSAIEENKVKFIIEDNGLGISAEKLKEINELLESRDDKAPANCAKNGRVGLKNVHDRIRLYFGENYGVILDSEQNNGTRVTITIPIIHI